MTPEAAVDRLTTIIAARAEFSEDDIYRAMGEAGVPGPVADRAFKFTQLAWARVLLDGLGIKFAPDYLCFNAAGDVVESGMLADQPYFAAAMAAAKKYSRTPGFSRLALMSADVNAVNSALQAGSKPENLVMSPAALFVEAPTQVGVDKVNKVLTERAASARKAIRPAAQQPAPPSAPARKPWWRFW